MFDSKHMLFSAGVVVDGDIRINGRPLGDYMHRLSGFMHQEDLFVSSLTVNEHLSFMVRVVSCT
jgi:ABC-type multidrug transport system ATPase subunit